MQMSDNLSAIFAASLRNSGEWFDIFQEGLLGRASEAVVCSSDNITDRSTAPPAPVLLPPCPVQSSRDIGNATQGWTGRAGAGQRLG